MPYRRSLVYFPSFGPLSILEDIGPQLQEELLHLNAIYQANFGIEKLPPLELLNKIHSLKFEALFPNVVIAVRLFCTIPVTVASTERSFSCLARIKNDLSSTMNQGRTSDLVQF
uniref:HAT C-terminal dimerisation domain-containing protein n=1 Tax=Photinus pyralis TaxID=7054 RepID=A0A1Y1KF85_PHOPY